MFYLHNTHIRPKIAEFRKYTSSKTDPYHFTQIHIPLCNDCYEFMQRSLHKTQPQVHLDVSNVRARPPLTQKLKSTQGRAAIKCA